MSPYAVPVPAAAAFITRPGAVPAPGPLPPPAAPAPPGLAAGETHLELGAVDTAPGCGRGLLREFLARHGLAHLRDPGEEILTELVSNAIAASVRKAPAGAEPCPVTLWLTVRDGELCIRVWDPDPAPPPRGQPLPDDDAEHGRGLFLVNALARRWGHYPGPHGGKYTWATLEAAGQPAAGGTP